MATKTLEKLKAKIAEMQKEAAALEAEHAKEVAEVVAKMKVAIEHYGLTAADLGLAGRLAKSVKAPVKTAGKKARKVTVAKLPAAKKPPGVIKYRDEAGNTWTGHGKRPGWFKAAIESGKKAEEFLVKAEVVAS